MSYKNHRTNVLLIYTGGTIGMRENPATGALESFNFDLILDEVPELRRFDFDIHAFTFDPPIDSSDMGLEHWARLVRVIADCYDRFDGFVILHGLHGICPQLHAREPGQARHPHRLATAYR